MTTTLDNIKIGISKEAGMYLSGTTTSAGDSGGTTLICTSLSDYPDRSARMLDSWVRITSGTYDNEVRRITQFLTDTGTVTVSRPFSGQIASSVTFEMYPFNPADMLVAFNDAIQETNYLFQRIDSTSYASRFGVHRYPLPSTFVGDALQIKISKEPYACEPIHSCDTLWDELIDTDTTELLDDRDYQQGTASNKFTIGASMAANDIIATDSITSADLSDHAGVMFSIKSSVATSAGDLQLLLDDTASCASAVESLDIPALVANEWQRVFIDYAGTNSSRAAIISVGLKYVTDLGAMTVWIDDINSVTNLPVDSLADTNSYERLWNWY